MYVRKPTEKTANLLITFKTSKACRECKTDPYSCSLLFIFDVQIKTILEQ